MLRSYLLNFVYYFMVIDYKIHCLMNIKFENFNLTNLIFHIINIGDHKMGRVCRILYNILLLGKSHFTEKLYQF